jgi:tyrosinase
VAERKEVAMADGLILRKRVDALSEPELAALRNAYAKMQGLMDNRGYNYWAGVHGIPQHYCWHHSSRLPRTGPRLNLFLPWHRAYIKYWELAMQDQNQNAVLPWWRWYGGFPAAFSAQNVGGNPNPLYKAHISRPNANPPIDRDTRRFPGQGVPSTVRLPTSGEIAALYNITQFQQFSNQLEEIHDTIHGWTGGISGGVGGDMGTIATAAYDPIFWSHHCMIDRVWYVWQLRNGINNIPAEYMDVILAPFRYRVRDVLNINALGYEYAVGAA